MLYRTTGRLVLKAKGISETGKQVRDLKAIALNKQIDRLRAINRNATAQNQNRNRKETTQAAGINIAGRIKIIKTVPAVINPARQQNNIDETHL